MGRALLRALFTCDRCGRANPGDITFCQDCGHRLSRDVQRDSHSQLSRPLAPDFDFSPKPLETSRGGPNGGVSCGSCGVLNPLGNRFCTDCGLALAGGEPAPPVERPPSPRPPPAALIGSPVVNLASGGGQHAEQRVACARCRGVNTSSMQYCQYCGAPLEHAQPLPAAGTPGTAARPPPGAAPKPAALVPEAGGSSPGLGTPEPAPIEHSAVPTTAPCGGDAPPLAVPAEAEPRARLVVIAQDGTPGREFGVDDTQTDVGREEGAILLPNDPYVSPRHARVYVKNSRFFVRDLGSVNGVYVRLRRPEILRNADLVLIGLEVLRFELVTDAEKGLGPAAERGTQVFGSPASARFARLCQRTVEGVTRDVYHLTRDETVIGREAGDVVFTSDPFMSRRHAVITRDRTDESFTLRDLGSSNGTYLAIRGELGLEHGDHLRIGQHLFRLEVD